MLSRVSESHQMWYLLYLNVFFGTQLTFKGYETIYSARLSGGCYWLDAFVFPGYDVAGPVAIGLAHWKNPYAQGRPALPSDLPLLVSKDAGIPVYHRSFARRSDLATPLSCPASLSITPVPSYSSSSQETLSQDTTGNGAGFLHGILDSVSFLMCLPV